MRMIAGVLAAGAALNAGIWWEEESQNSGGSLVSMAARIPGAKKALEPKRTTHGCDGTVMVTKDGQTERVVDAAKGTLTTINHARKTYSVTQLDQVRETIKGARGGGLPRLPGRKPVEAKGTGAPLPMTVTETGKTYQIAGHTCREFVVTMQGVQSTQCTAKVPGFEQVNDFYRKLGGKLLPGSAGLSSAAAFPTDGLPSNVKELGEQVKKMEGMRLSSTNSAGGINASTEVLRIWTAPVGPAVIPAAYTQQGGAIQ